MIGINVLFSITGIISMVILFVAATTDPGIIPRKTAPNPFSANDAASSNGGDNRSLRSMDNRKRYFINKNDVKK
jgi:uncharacterized FlgJ-related protein